jgi:hypothetical protein
MARAGRVGLRQATLVGDKVQRVAPFALALFVLATTRWGTYVVPGPPYLVDLVIAVLIVERLVAIARTRSISEPPVATWVALAGAGLLVWTGIALATSSLTEVALRDAAAFAYVILVFVTAPVAGERRISTAITVALVFHALWVTTTRLGWTGDSIALSGGDAFLFGLRADIDASVCGLLAAIAIYRVLSNRAPILNLLLAGWATTLVLHLNTRAGLLAYLVQVLAVVAVLAIRARADRTPAATTHARSVTLGGQLGRGLVLVLVLTAIPMLTLDAFGEGPLDRLAATFGEPEAVEDEEDARERQAAGTAQARFDAWEHLVDWIAADPKRTLVGVGVGPDYLAESGTAEVLLGTQPLNESRHPHNFFLTAWARLGLIGLGLTAMLLVVAVVLAVRITRQATPIAEADVLAICVLLSLPVTGALGVVLESPFGAIPYYWAIAQLSGRACELGVATPVSKSIRRLPLPGGRGA